jgi:predicted ATPase
MFTAIRLKNFKAYQDSQLVPLKPLTLVLGANNSGKSSLLQAVLLLAQTLDDSTSRQPLVTSGTYVDLGGYFDIIWGAQSRRADSFSIELNISRESAEGPYVEPDTDADTPLPTDLDVTFVFDSEKNAIVVSSCSVEGDKKIFAAARRAGRGYMAPHLSDVAREGLTLDFRHFLPTLIPGKRLEDRKRRREIMDFYFYADQAWFSWSSQLARVAHVAPLRQPVPRFGILGKSLTSDLGPGGENLLRVLRAGDEDSGSGERLANLVSQWISENFKMLRGLQLVDVDDAGTILALLGDERRGFSGINVANMGEGLSQLLPIITRVLTTPEDGALLIEQPELHLHPAAQSDLADLFIAGVERGRRQYIIETHSEHLLLRLRRRVAEGRIDPDLVSVLYVERNGSSSSVRALDIDPSGHFDDWPKDFLDERYREALAIAEAGDGIPEA